MPISSCAASPIRASNSPAPKRRIAPERRVTGTVTLRVNSHAMPSIISAMNTAADMMTVNIRVSPEKICLYAMDSVSR